MLITTSDSSHCARRSFVGELDIATEVAARTSLGKAIGSGYGCVEIDFAGLSFMDCAGIRVLLCAPRQARRENVHLRLVGRNAKVQRILDLTDLAWLFPTGPTRIEPHV